jgi:L-gulonolactone oxidase
MSRWLAEEAADPEGIRVHFPIEIRWTSDDDIWLSPSFGRQTVYIGIVQYRWAASAAAAGRVSPLIDLLPALSPYGLSTPYRRYFSRFVSIISSHAGRPHWAKAHDLTPVELRELYPRFPDFVDLIEKRDPAGIFRNEYVRRHLLGEKTDDVDAGCFRSSGRKGQ